MSLPNIDEVNRRILKIQQAQRATFLKLRKTIQDLREEIEDAKSDNPDLPRLKTELQNAKQALEVQRERNTLELSQWYLYKRSLTATHDGQRFPKRLLIYSPQKSSEADNLTGQLAFKLGEFRSTRAITNATISNEEYLKSVMDDQDGVVCLIDENFSSEDWGKLEYLKKKMQTDRPEEWARMVLILKNRDVNPNLIQEYIKSGAAIIYKEGNANSEATLSEILKTVRGEDIVDEALNERGAELKQEFKRQ